MSKSYVKISLSASLANQFQAACSIIRNINSHMNLVFSTNGEYRFGYQMLTASIGVERPQFTWAFTKWVGRCIGAWSGQLVYCGMRKFGKGMGQISVLQYIQQSPIPWYEHKAVTVDIRTLINCMLFPTGSSISTARAISVHDNIWWHRDLLQVMEPVLLRFRLVALCPSLWITNQLHRSRDNIWTGRLKNRGQIPG